MEDKKILHLYNNRERFDSKKVSNASDINKLISGFNRLSREEKETLMILLNAFLLKKNH